MRRILTLAVYLIGASFLLQSCGGDVPPVVYNLQYQKRVWINARGLALAGDPDEYRCIPSGTNCGKTPTCAGCATNQVAPYTVLSPAQRAATENFLTFYHDGKTLDYFNSTDMDELVHVFPDINTRPDIVDALKAGTYKVQVAADTSMGIFAGQTFSDDSVVLVFTRKVDE